MRRIDKNNRANRNNGTGDDGAGNDGAGNGPYFTYNDEKYGDLHQKYLDKKIEEFPPNIERKNNSKIIGNKYNLANPLI